MHGMSRMTGPCRPGKDRGPCFLLATYPFLSLGKLYGHLPRELIMHGRLKYDYLVADYWTIPVSYSCTLTSNSCTFLRLYSYFLFSIRVLDDLIPDFYSLMSIAPQTPCITTVILLIFDLSDSDPSSKSR